MIIKKTAFCTNKTCCPTVEINIDTNTVTITDDFDGTVVMSRETFLSANSFAKKLSEKRLDISGSATFSEIDYTIVIENQEKYATLINQATHEKRSTDILLSQQYYLSLEHQGQKIKDITLVQWNILADAVLEKRQSDATHGKAIAMLLLGDRIWKYFIYDYKKDCVL